MSREIEQVRREVAETRARLSETADELKDTMSQRVERAKNAVSPAHYAREYPWVALGLAIGAGLALGLTGREKKAAQAAAKGARTAGSAIGEGAIAAVNAVIGHFSGDSTPDAVQPEDASPGLRARATSTIHDLLDDGLEEVLGALGVSREEVQQRRLS